MKKYLVIILVKIFILSKVCQSQDLTPEQIYEKVNDAIVVILTYDFNGSLYKQGSGVVLNDMGYVVTNYHVYAEGKSIEIKHNDKIITYTDILSVDEEKDLLILKIQDNTFPHIPIGDSKSLKVGQRVYAVGSPLGLENSISEGIISGLRNTYEKNRNLIQITASISAGSSGGAIINARGELIGISTMTMKGGQNLNFAIPINDVLSLPISDYKDKLDIKGNNLFYAGVNALDAGNYEDALNLFKEYIKFFSDDEVAFLNLGLTYFYLESYTEAKKCFDKAISLKRDYLDAYFNRALTYHFFKRI